MPNTKGLTVNGRPVSDDEYKAYWNDIFQRDPEMQRIFQQVSGGGNDQRISQAQQTLAQLEPQMQQIRQMAGTGQRPTPQQMAIADAYNEAQFVATRGGSEQGREYAFDQRARELGWETPGEGWSLDFDESGPRVEREGYLQRNKQWIIPAAAGAAAGIGLATGGAAGAAGGASGAAGGSGAAVPAAGASVGPGVGFGAGGAPVGTAGFASGGGTLGGVGAGTAAGWVGPAISNGGFWGKVAAGIGGDLLNGYLNNRSANKAADELIKAGDKQVALYNKALGPYMDPGPLNALKFLSGLPAGGSPVQGSTTGTPVPGTGPTATANGGRLAPPGVPSLGTAGPRPGRLASLTGATPQAQAQQQQASSYVRMVGPDGTEDDVHPSQVQNAMAIGARRVG